MAAIEESFLWKIGGSWFLLFDFRLLESHDDRALKDFQEHLMRIYACPLPHQYLNPTTKTPEKWIEDFYHLMGTLDLPKFTSTYLKEDVLFHFTNLPPMKGRESLFSVFGLLGGCLYKYNPQVRSRLHNLVQTTCLSFVIRVTDLKVLSDRIMAASTVDYIFINGEKCSMNAFAILHKTPEEEQASQYFIYGDFTPCYQILGNLKAAAEAEESEVRT
ncbi:hypothetical protein EV421DRAFT_2029590 [Armillaria borealis]|uniref:Uncharacterized protein n=1 Tax=Armillaria borealis TaxID=47425 RepID=A0AA39N230_9AGAR|nr:hypothetical protein EV421DRAFT_2029590 [Armillaria borealis]